MTISDGAANSNSISAAIVVNSINDPPTLDPVGNVTVTEDPTEPSVVSLTGITAGVGEGTQSVVVTISTAKPELIELIGSHLYRRNYCDRSHKTQKPINMGLPRLLSGFKMTEQAHHHLI